jgi:hypothetical protein
MPWFAGIRSGDESGDSPTRAYRFIKVTGLNALRFIVRQGVK